MYGMRRGCDRCQIEGTWISLNHSVPAGKYSLAVTILGASLSTAAGCPCTTGGLWPTSPPKASKPGGSCWEAGGEWGVVIKESRGWEQRCRGWCQSCGLEVNRRGGRTVAHSTVMGWSLWEQVVPCDNWSILETPRSWHLSNGHMLAIRVHAKFCFSSASQ